MDQDTTKSLDVRQIPPPQRHPMIFQTFDELGSGQSFILVNDHDPKALYYQFLHEREGKAAGNSWRKVPRPGGYRSAALPSARNA